MKEDTLIQLYWAIFEAWSAQVDSYWTRTNYFAAFEIAAIGGTWVVLNANDLTVGRYSLVLASFLTASWIFSNVKSHDYLMYWWKALAEIEAMPGWEQKKPDFVSGHPKRRKKLRGLAKIPYHYFTNWFVPLALLAVWVALVYTDWNGTTHVPQINL